MSRQAYLDELKQIRNDVIKMGTYIEESVEKVMSALKNTNAKLAEEIMKEDDRIDDLEREIEKKCITIIAKQQPVASDLRKITSIMRMISDIERIADHCSDISEYIIELSKEKEIPTPLNVFDMIIAMKEMVLATIDCYINEDVEKAKWVIDQDDVIDGYFIQIKEELSIAMKYNPDQIKQYVDFLMIIKYVERMADHSTNIAGWILFIATGKL